MSSLPTQGDQVESQAKPANAAVTRPDSMPADVIEFIQAVDSYKRIHDRKFPNLSELLTVLKELGYQKG